MLRRAVHSPVAVGLAILVGLVLAPGAGARAHNILYSRIVHIRFTPEGVDIAILRIVHPGPEALRA